MAIFFLLTCSRSCVHDCGPARSLSWITYPRIRSRECVSRLRLREPGSSICRPIRPTSILLNKPGRRSSKSCAHSRHAPPMRLKPQSLRLSPRLLPRTQSPGFLIVAIVYNKFENALRFAFCCRLERLYDISAHPREHEGLYKRCSEPVRPLQSNRCRERVAHAFALGNEFVHESRVVTSLALDKVDAR